MDEERAVAVLALADKTRDTAADAIDRLRRLGVTPVMITGDAEAVAATVAAELGIDRYYARVLPQDKARIVGELKSEGPTAFVGDGINDAPALLEADLGVAIGAGTNVAIESADLVLVEDDPADVARAITLSRATHRKMNEILPGPPALQPRRHSPRRRSRRRHRHRARPRHRSARYERLHRHRISQRHGTATHQTA